jgi:hypothetical protein
MSKAIQMLFKDLPEDLDAGKVLLLLGFLDGHNHAVHNAKLGVAFHASCLVMRTNFCTTRQMIQRDRMCTVPYAGLANLAQLSDFSSRKSLEHALAVARHSVHSRQRAEEEGRKPKRSLVLPRVSHVELPADPRFQHLALRSTRKKPGVPHIGEDGEVDSSDDSDSDYENRGRKPRWSSSQKREAKEERRYRKRVRQEKEKARRKALETPLKWEE